MPLDPSLELPASPGTYALILHLAQARAIQVGRLGMFRFPAGFYAYLGSAYGPGGLRARLGRHLADEKRLHWHIDYLRQAAPVTALWLVERQRQECTWAQALATLPGARQPVPGFGASDCACPSHLIHFPEPPALADLRQRVGSALAIQALAVR